MSDSPKHRSITGQLATEILAGKYNQSGRLPSETQLVRRFGVSRPTISQALRGLQEQGMVERRPGSGTYLSLSHSSRETRQPASCSARPLLGMILPSLRHTEIFESIVGEIAGLIRGGEYDFWPGMTAKPLIEPRMTVEEAEALCERFIQEGVRGVFLVPFEHQADREDANRRIAARLRLAGIPLVLIDRDIGPFPVRSAHDLIGTDNFSGG